MIGLTTKEYKDHVIYDKGKEEPPYEINHRECFQSTLGCREPKAYEITEIDVTETKWEQQGKELEILVRESF